MASPKASGRMIRRSISDSEKIARLSPEAAVLFMMLIPHYNAHGKMHGSPGLVKDLIVPLIPYFTYDNIPGYLQEISDHTNVKWFQDGNKWWIHSLNFNTDHQTLKADKMGADELPGFKTTNSGTSPELVPDIPSAREDLKVRSKEENLKPQQQHAGVRERFEEVLKENRQRLSTLFPTVNLEVALEKLIVHCRGKPVLDPYDRLIRWLQNEFTSEGDASGTTSGGRSKASGGKAKGGITEPNGPGTDWTSGSGFATV